MREEPRSRGSYASLALTVIYGVLVQPRTRAPDGDLGPAILGEKHNYPNRALYFKERLA